ncbi:MAG: HDOD domain-containing protein [Anaerolineales bacterium]|nr:HDOD domain-containing protein [Anaerolineales bacterium]
MLTQDALVGRQPIFNYKTEVIGYELLYRSSSQTDRAEIQDKDRATTEVIINAFASIGIDSIIGDAKAFINFTRNFLLGKNPIPLHPKRIVLEVMEDTQIDRPLIEALRNLAKRGFTIALDDVIDPNSILPLLDVAHIIKMELPCLSKTQIITYAKFYQQRGLKVVAEKVETLKEFEFCKNLGIDYFQGYYLCKPNLVKGRQLKPSLITRLRLLQKIQDPYVDFEDIEKVVSQDVAISYRLLRLVNSAVYGLRREIESIHQAITLLGLDQVRKWFTLFFIMEMGDKPPELLTIALVRAQMSEFLAKAMGLHNVEKYFLVGLLSVLDALTDLPLEQVINTLPISNEMRDGLLNHTGTSGDILLSVLAYEQGNWDNVLKINLPTQTIRGAYLNSLQFAKTMLNEMMS